MNAADACNAGVPMANIVNNDEDMIKSLLHRMASCPGMCRCFKRPFNRHRTDCVLHFVFLCHVSRVMAVVGVVFVVFVVFLLGQAS